MALRTMEDKKKVLHTEKQIIRRSGMTANSSPGQTRTDGNGSSESGRIFMPEDKGTQSFSGTPIENRAKTSAKQRNSGKVIHTVARPSLDVVNNHDEGGEKPRESEQILMAMGVAGKRVFRTRRQKSMNRASYDESGGSITVKARSAKASF